MPPWRASLAEQLGLPDAVLDALGVRVRAVGRPRLAGRAARRRMCRWRRGWRSWPSSWRWRTASAGSTPPRALARERGGQAVRPRAGGDARGDEGELILGGPRRRRHLGCGDRRRAGARRRALGRRSFDAALLAIANFVDLKSPYTLGHARRGRRPRRRRRRAARAGRRRRAHAAARRPRARPRPAGGLERDLGQARAAGRRRVGAGADAPVPDRAHAAPVRVAGAAGRDRRAAPRAPGRLGLPARPLRRGDLAAGPDPGRRRRLSGDARAAPATGRRCRPTRPRPSCAPRSGPAGSTPTRSRRCSARPATASPRRREGPAGLTPREVEVLRCSPAGCRTSRSRERLVISPKTVGNHVEHIYAKIDAIDRAAASLFAMQHGLLPEEDSRRPTSDARRWGERPMPAGAAAPSWSQSSQGRARCRRCQGRAPSTSGPRPGRGPPRGCRRLHGQLRPFGADIDAHPAAEGPARTTAATARTGAT